MAIYLRVKRGSPEGPALGKRQSWLEGGRAGQERYERSLLLRGRHRAA